ncbi:Clp protease [Citrobacter braakii]|nr:Clp protease [Citrobacter braakii]
MVVGKTGSGKTVTQSQVIRVFLAQSDVSRLKELYSGDDGERLAEAIRQNCNIWYPLKPGDEGQ